MVTFRGITYTIETVTGSGQTIEGTSGNDWIDAPGSNNKIETGKGNDVILAGLKFDSISPYSPYGGDAIFFYPLPITGNTTIDAGAGDDYVAVGQGNYSVDLGDGNNVFDGSTTSGYVRVSAGNGNDIIDAGGIGGTYQVDAGGGNNWIYLAAGNASVSSGSGNDVITMDFPVGFFNLLTYVFDLTGQPYKQAINAGNGNNQIELPVFGQTSISTGSGSDFILAISVSSQLLGNPLNSDTVNIDTGSGNDTVITIDTKSLIKLGSGTDTVYAGAGDDTIYAGSGQNTINLRGLDGPIPIPSPVSNLGFLGSSFPVQGGGNDTVYLSGGRDTIVLGSSGFATIYGFGRNDLLDIRGLNATLSTSGGDTLIKAGNTSLGVLKGYTGSVGLV
jgi:hypothetical protein